MNFSVEEEKLICMQKKNKRTLLHPLNDRA